MPNGRKPFYLFLKPFLFINRINILLWSAENLLSHARTNVKKILRRMVICYFLRQTMGGDGSNIRLIYIEDEQQLFPQIAKKTNVPHARMCPTLPYIIEIYP